MSRYLVIGCGGSGKSTLAKAIARKLGIPYVDSDSMYWQKNWRLLSDAEVVRGLPLDSDAWAIDGNFVDFREEVWAKADHIIWLNYPLCLILWRITRRNLGWWLTQKPVWSGNRMPLFRGLSGIRHSFRQHARLQKTFPEFLGERKDQKIQIFGSPVECDLWFNKWSAEGGV